ncbi:M64 family metallopeptidase [Nonomuraea cavernae]|uniref:M64 family metallopeptidase n=1 Tax=Nonomuraea cavernae TaxID=2045107 RepID=UPI0033D57663
MRHSLRLALCVLITAATALASAPASAAIPPPETESVEVFSPDGTISRVEVPKRAEQISPFAVPPPANVTALQQTGPTGQRYDLVFVGDGYTSSQIATFHAHVASQWAVMTTVEPFKTYKNSFNVWMVEVISSQSGVDNDPTQGVSKNTALGMGFWCSGIERLLCVNESTALSYAANAPAVDHVIALGNSTKYGGAGGRVATASGGNASSGQVVVHELGHSMGGLADEYTEGTSRYRGSEPSAANITIYTAAQLTSNRRKWYQYLGQATPDGGVIGTYAGAYGYTSGIYRPSENSLMRTLGRPFNLIGLDAMTRAITAKLG